MVMMMWWKLMRVDPGNIGTGGGFVVVSVFFCNVIPLQDGFAQGRHDMVLGGAEG